MASIVVFSGSTNGRPINITDTATLGQVIHGSGSAVDEMTMWATNRSSTIRELNVEIGGAGGVIQIDIPINDSVLVLDSVSMEPSTNLTVFESSGASCAVVGYVLRLG